MRARGGRYGRRMQVRLTLLVGLTAVLAVIAVSALVAPVPTNEVRRAPTPAPSGSPAAVRTDLDPPAGRPYVLSATETGQVVSVPPRTEALIRVHAVEPVSVQLGDDGPIALAEPGTPAEFPIFGDAGAKGAIRLLDPVREIGRVELER